MVQPRTQHLEHGTCGAAGSGKPSELACLCRVATADTHDLHISRLKAASPGVWASCISALLFKEQRRECCASSNASHSAMRHERTAQETQGFKACTKQSQGQLQSSVLRTACGAAVVLANGRNYTINDFSNYMT